MDRKYLIKQEVKKTLDAYRNKETIEPSPFFYNRLQAKIDENKRELSIKKIFNIDALRPALLITLVTINLISAYLVFQKSEHKADTQKEILTAFTTEYSLNQNDFNF